MCIFRRLCTNLCTYESWKSINCCFLVHRYLTRSTVHPIGPRKCINPAFQSKDIPYTAFYASTCTSVVHKMACCGIYAYAWKHQFLHEWKPGTCTEPFWMYVNIRKHHSVLNRGHCAHPEGCVLHVVACTRQFVHNRGQCRHVEGCALPRTIHMCIGVFNARAHYQAPVCALLRCVSMDSGQCKVSLH